MRKRNGMDARIKSGHDDGCEVIWSTADEPAAVRR
jgi:hypothetical protein